MDDYVAVGFAGFPKGMEICGSPRPLKIAGAGRFYLEGYLYMHLYDEA